MRTHRPLVDAHATLHADPHPLGEVRLGLQRVLVPAFDAIPVRHFLALHLALHRQVEVHHLLARRKHGDPRVLAQVACEKTGVRTTQRLVATDRRRVTALPTAPWCLQSIAWVGNHRLNHAASWRREAVKQRAILAAHAACAVPHESECVCTRTDQRDVVGQIRVPVDLLRRLCLGPASALQPTTHARSPPHPYTQGRMGAVIS